jgi:Helix-turn-helix domain
VKPVVEQTLYEILEVPPDAPESEIVRAWERAEALYGPGSLSTYTLVSPDEAAAMSARLEEALNVLLDPAERGRYDASLCAKPVPCVVRPEVVSFAWPRPNDFALPPIIPPLAVVPPADGRHAGNGAASNHLGAAAAEAGRAPDDTQPVQAEALPAHEMDGTDPPPILLSEVAAEPLELIRLATPAPISPPFAALLESPAALAVSPLALPAPLPEVPEPSRAQESVTSEEGLIVPEGAPFTGDVLRRAREARGLTIQQISERTKISRHHLENLEADRHEKLPAPVYLRGFLMALARELRLDGQKVARSYLEAAAAQAREKARS